MAKYAQRAFGAPFLYSDTTGYTVSVGGTPLTDVQAGSVTFTNTVGRRGTANFTLHSTLATHFQQYQQMSIIDRYSTLVFSGYIMSPKEQKPGYQPSLMHTLSCVDQHFLADKRRYTGSFTNKTCGFIVQTVATAILAQEGVTIAQIYDGLTPSTTLYPATTLYPGGNVGLIPSAVFTNGKVSDILDALTTAASASGVLYYWMIDQYKQLWFVPYTAVTGPSVDGTTIEQRSNACTVTRQNPSYRNTQYIVGGVGQTLTQTEIRKGDGNTQAWAMGYDLLTVPTVTVNGTAKVMGIKGVDTGKDFYWGSGDPVITQDSAAVKLISTDTLQVVYVGQFPSIVVSANNAQIAYQASIDGSSGIVEDVLSDPTITSVANGLAEASQLLTRYAVQGTILQFTTMTAGYAPGQLCPVNLPMHALNNVQMLVENVVASDQSDLVNIWYTVTMVQGPSDTTWVSFFSKLLLQQTPANSINVGTSQTAQLLSSFTSTIAETLSLVVTVYSCPIPNITLLPSLTLFAC